MTEENVYKTFKTKKDLNTYVKDAIAGMDSADDLFCVGIDAKGEKGEFTPSVSFENTADESTMAAFIDKYGQEMEIRLLEWGENTKRGRHEKKQRKAAENPQGQSGGGRRSSLAGAEIHPREMKEGEEPEHTFKNPRREGTHGWHSWEILRKHWEENGGRPMNYDDYVKAGGRPNDLRWDYDRGHVRVIKPDTAGAPADESEGTSAPANESENA